MPYTPKLIALDLDGTLLHDDKTLSGYTCEVLGRCRERGIKLAVATARPVRTSREYCERIQPAYTACHNGAVILSAEKTLSYGISKEDVRQILAFLTDSSTVQEIAVEIQDCLYANFEADRNWKGLAYVRSDFQHLPEQNADKILFNFTPDDDLSTLYQQFADDFNILIADGVMGMIMSKSASKLNALKQIAKFEGMGTGDILYFGDDHNDAEAVRGCGLGVAVANANESVKLAADALCGSNNEDGVARWIERNVLM